MPIQRAGTTYWRVSELAKVLGVHRNTVILWIGQDMIKAVRAGASPKSPYLIPESEIKRVFGKAVIAV